MGDEDNEMNEAIKITTETTTLYEMSVRQIAEAFMGMDSELQAEFFSHCAAIQQEWIDRADGDFCMPAMQWFYVRDELKESKYNVNSGWDFVMDLAAPFYVHFDPGFLGR